jgi:putative ABC transport system ATP-binding protein
MTQILLKDVVHKYDDNTTIYLPNINIKDDDPLLIIGRSGTGKSTMLHILGGLTKPSQGTVSINGEEISKYNQKQLDSFRSKNIGIIFQNSHFLQAVDVLENVCLSQYFGSGKEDKNYAISLLQALGLGRKIYSKTEKLSVGEKQRVAIARALANRPKIILADEPTSALDDENCFKVVDQLRESATLAKAKLIIVTHDGRLKNLFSNQITLS